jgi:hypothetical protein
MSFIQELKEAYPYKSELHCHTHSASGCATASPEQLVRLYASEGYTTVVMTNHMLFGGMKNAKALQKAVASHREDYEKGKNEGEKFGVNVLFAAELRFEGDINDYLFYGVNPDFYENIDFSTTRSLEAFSKAFRGEDTLLIQAHPFRTGITLAPLELIDGIEVFNLSTRINSRVGMAAQYAEENKLISTCGTDFHHVNDGQLSALCTREPIDDVRKLVRVVKSGDLCWKIGASRLVF